MRVPLVEIFPPPPSYNARHEILTSPNPSLTRKMTNRLMNKVRPGSIARVDKGEDGVVRTSNITKFLASCYSTLELSRGDLFHCDDLIEGSFESLARVSRTIIALVEGSENPPPRSPLRPELEVLDGPVSFPRTVSGSVVNLGVATNTASTSELLNRSASEDNMVRLTLIVNEEGKPVMQFVSIFFGPSLSSACGVSRLYGCFFFSFN